MDMCYDGALVMPSSYAVMNEEEMTYVEGGKYISKSDCINGLCAIGMNPSTFIAATLTFTLAKKLIQKISSTLGGFFGWVVGLVLGWAGSQLIAFGVGLARGALNKGVDVTWNWNIFTGPVGIECAVRS